MSGSAGTHRRSQARQHLLAFFVVVGLGYLLGRVPLLGFRLGVAGVLFAGLALSGLDPRIELPEFIPSLGLIVFVYTVGIQAGPQFFDSFRSRGYRYALLAASTLLFGAALTFGLAHTFGLSGARAAGLYSGALTNTPALAAAREKAKASGGIEDPVAAYSIAYPFGVIGALIALQIAHRRWPIEESAAHKVELSVRTFQVTNPRLDGKSVSDVVDGQTNPRFIISRVSHPDEVILAAPETKLL
ncbi:MAG: hypothetical protein WKF37_05740 [Bryobacteraceae bacterium]